MADKLSRAYQYNGPPLPPRSSSPLIAPPPAYNEVNSPYSGLPLAPNDPRSSSTQSLVPEESQSDGQRRLLLIYIHGFMGNETSFQSFPAHVHNLVTVMLADSHIVHTKIYPRYKSRRTVDEVSEDFSRWLAPHESPDTDVILLSHSMGGLVAAEVVLLPPYSQATGLAFRHRIIGFINFDVPFLGMHPGVITSGLGSLFKSAPEKSGAPPQDGDESVLTSPSTTTLSSQTTSSTSHSGRPPRQDTLFSSPLDPNFNPAFQNDVVIPVRKGWRSAMHFMNKHSDDLRQATKQYVKSHFEFGRAMADFNGLKTRYSKVRALEDENEESRKRATQCATTPPRVRFVNYYTASTGRPKKPQSRSPSRPTTPIDLTPEGPPETEMQGISISNSSPPARSLSRSPRISIEEHRNDGVIHKEADDLAILSPMAIDDDSLDPESPASLASLDSITSKSSPTVSAVDSILGVNFHVSMPNLPPISAPPTEPTPLDLTPYPNKAAQKIAQKEYERRVKAYKQAVKDRDAAIKDREKLETKMRKIAAKEMLKQRKEDDRSKGKPNEDSKKEKENRQNEAPGSCIPEPSQADTALTQNTGIESSIELASMSQISTINSSHSALSPTSTHAEQSRDSTSTEHREKEQKKKKDRKFCMLPAKNSSGERDPAWIRVYMEGVDEVGAHCGLFFLSETYERLVGDVGGRIEDWVREDMTRRLVEEVSGR